MDCRHVQPSLERSDSIIKGFDAAGITEAIKSAAATFIIAFAVIHCFEWKHGYSQDMKINMTF